MDQSPPKQQFYFESPFRPMDSLNKSSTYDFTSLNNQLEMDIEDEDSLFNSHRNILSEPPRPTGLLMKFIFLFHPMLLFLFILPGVLTFWILFIAGESSLKPFFYIVFLLVPLVFQIVLLIYHSNSFVFLNYGLQALSRKYNNSVAGQYGQLYQLVDIQSGNVVTMLDQRIADEKAMYLYIPVTKEVFNMSYYESTLRINALGHWQVVLTWKALLSFFVFGVMLSEFILLFVLKSWFLQLF
ncbi:hypothetical protein DICPUDRAFT_98930 [Dictyostelium purpureum]|uniref:Transmembrane protein n=1 Tax=Dictyostelium purpureum TaxID=5786 RepID=F0ZUV7_DICPU|nr:uncharacterized protein DICPUDRAFT_98930 [Dictyostelium purpureum]EGC32271.1 hypothetical protein DICPUDRAFT_98930 [Dictyostelium purpureum]|eukprot:XP_003291208.1 hypothetical protein DICPUDRAFT_98930 [Dictyostelium purpureum]